MFLKDSFKKGFLSLALLCGVGSMWAPDAAATNIQRVWRGQRERKLVDGLRLLRDAYGGWNGTLVQSLFGDKINQLRESWTFKGNIFTKQSVDYILLAQHLVEQYPQHEALILHYLVELLSSRNFYGSEKVIFAKNVMEVFKDWTNVQSILETKLLELLANGWENPTRPGMYLDPRNLQLIGLARYIITINSRLENLVTQRLVNHINNDSEVDFVDKLSLAYSVLDNPNNYIGTGMHPLPDPFYFDLSDDQLRVIENTIRVTPFAVGVFPDFNFYLRYLNNYKQWQSKRRHDATLDAALPFATGKSPLPRTHIGPIKRIMEFVGGDNAVSDNALYNVFQSTEGKVGTRKAAATDIQRLWRGHLARNRMRDMRTQRPDNVPARAASRLD